jgi:hypothetical protein
MNKASLVLTALLASVPAFGLAIVGCSSDDSSGSSPDASSGTGQNGNDSGNPQQGGGQDSSTSTPDSSAGGGGQDSSTGGGGNDAGTGPTDAQTGGGDASWVDMNFPDGGANSHACDNEPGVPCGWSAANNGLGYTCRCAFPGDLDPWGCAAPDSGAPASCAVDGG